MRRPPISEALLVTASVADGTRPTTGTTWGTSVTPAQNAYGASWANLGVLSSAYDILEWTFSAHNIGVNGASRTGMVQLGMDLAGGTSFTAFLADLVVGPASSATAFPLSEQLNAWRFRRRIPAGASIGVRGAVNSATLTAFRAHIFDAWGRPTRPDVARTHEYCESIGASLSNCQGVTITPGTTSEGAWTAIGSATRRLEWLEYGLALDDTAIAATNIAYVDLGVGDASAPRAVIRNHGVVLSTSESTIRRGPAGTPCVINPGDTIYARAQLSGALPSSPGTISIAVYGCGG